MENLKELVKQEADNIKRFATADEIGRLDFEDLNPKSFNKCIYGQMTGNCSSDRAIDLLNDCTKPFSCRLDYREEPIVSCFSQSLRLDDENGFSPIEYYITKSYAKNDGLIAYLKSETDTLEL